MCETGIMEMSFAARSGRTYKVVAEAQSGPLRLRHTTDGSSPHLASPLLAASADGTLVGLFAPERDVAQVRVVLSGPEDRESDKAAVQVVECDGEGDGRRIAWGLS